MAYRCQHRPTFAGHQTNPGHMAGTLADRAGVEKSTPPDGPGTLFSGRVAQECAQGCGRVSRRDARPASFSPRCNIVVDILRPQRPELAICLLAPPQESRGRTTPLLHRGRCEAALITHPNDIPIELALVRIQDGGLTPPAKKPQPRSPNIDDPSRGASGPMKALPLLRNRQQLLHADAVVGIRTKTSARSTGAHSAWL